jgi:CRISPR-associated endonuclease/helicase Cas3
MWMMPDKQALTPERFADFYRKLHGYDPYLWQQRATRELTTGKVWPALFAPTGAGKTTLIECFLFALVCTVQENRRALPLRLFWVIDRRSVADQVFRHAESVVRKIEDGGHEVLELVRERLHGLAGEHSNSARGACNPVQVRLWRGGLTGEAAGDARTPLSPCAPAVICTTVDQIGSRMLFRGYGVARGSRPIEAALSATDSLIVLDEAHLSRPFRQTAAAIERAQRLVEEKSVNPLHLLRISATPDELVEGAFELTAEELAEPALARGFHAHKPVELRTSKDQVRRCAAEARRLASEGAMVVAVVVNTVATARSIYAALRSDGDAVLLIGPVRPLDRQGLLDRIPPREERTQLRRPLFVVGTQTIEVGVDLDFDALVTACAPVPSLAQRFGRLDRKGDMKGAGRGVIVEPPRDCPVYGKATATTWEWLLGISTGGEIDDLGPAAIEQLRKETFPPDPPAPPRAPILGPWHVELLMQTSHDPEPDPDVAVFLHGKLDDADVQICWRADLDNARADGVERMRARPPHPGELLPVSPGAARRWLKRQTNADDLSDVESAGEPPPRTSDDGTPERRVLRVRPPGAGGVIEVERIRAVELRPGDIIAVPANYGGCDEFGWAPESRQAVRDLSNLASSRPRILLPGSPQVAERLGVSEELHRAAQTTLNRIEGEELGELEAYEELLPDIVSWLEDGGGFAGESHLAQEAANLGARLDEASGAVDARRGRALPIGTPIANAEHAGDLLIIPPTYAATRSSGKPVLYEEHVEQVAERARSFARQLGLSEELVETIYLAARNHDAGKLDRRFQAWLNDGAQLDANKPLAKSGRNPRERRSREAQRVAEWPRGKRHESISATLVAEVEEWPPGIIRDLLIHLVLAHHGDGRPFRTIADDPDPVEVEAQIATHPSNGDRVKKVVMSDSEIPWYEHAGRFIALNERFGPWGLAALETILVLADRGVSAEEGQ